MHYSRLALLVVAALLVAATLSAQPYDLAGNQSRPSIGVDDPPGTKLFEWKPASNSVQGVAFNGDLLYQTARTASGHNILELDPVTGAIKSTTAITGLLSADWPWGLGWDSRRNEFIVGETATMSIMRIDLNGKVTTVVPTAPDRNVGAAYDSFRDAYWITSWNSNTLKLYDARTLTVLRTINLSTVGATRAAGTAYSAVNDVVYTSSRNTKKGYVFSAASGQLLYSYNLVYAGGNNGQGAAWFDRWQCPLVGDFEQIVFTYTDAGMPRVDFPAARNPAPSTVKFGNTLSFNWTSGQSPSKLYLAAASLTERVRGIPFDFGRHFPLAPDSLFFLSQLVPSIFVNFGGTLDPNGTASGALVVPNAPALVGVQPSIAFIASDAGSPLGIQYISGAWKVIITS